MAVGGNGKPAKRVVAALVLALIAFSLVSRGGGAESRANVVIEDGGYRLLVAADEAERVADCTAEELVEDQRCAGLEIVVMDAGRMPFVTRQLALAWEEGQPALLTRDTDPVRTENRRLSGCPSGTVTSDDAGCATYPFARTREGGAGARADEVPIREARCQDGTLSGAYQLQGIQDGDEFLPVISDPQYIADDAFDGTDIAPDTACGG